MCMNNDARAKALDDFAKARRLLEEMFAVKAKQLIETDYDFRRAADAFADARESAERLLGAAGLREFEVRLAGDPSWRP